MKVTDDSLVLKYRTDQATDLKKFERLNRSMMLKMQNRKEPNESEAATSSRTAVQQLTQALEQITEVIPDLKVGASSSGTSNPQPSSKKKGKKGR
ncbi:1811_t:CDS:2 [Acaulospora colombiana]|uniref:1811_t:CDS:1 n=1 Tax=Acaulospora colombiana TaxID=27376 RepID=A0ACA9KVB1_9GLOM|nr:1811_t:CDS:2 [Acaulospora colombiana]